MPLSPLIRFGTSTWTYEGWQGQVYLKKYAKTTFARECLGEYCQYLHNGEPCFRTVGNDSTFYHLPTANNFDCQRKAEARSIDDKNAGSKATPGYYLVMIGNGAWVWTEYVLMIGTLYVQCRAGSQFSAGFKLTSLKEMHTTL